MFYVRRSASSALLVFALAACSLTREPEQKAGVEELTAALQALIDSVAADPTIPGALLYAESPRLGLEWSGAAGVTDVATGAALPAVAPVRIASNTKTYVAAAVLRLWESGRLGLDDPIVDYLTESQAATLRGDGYDLNSITIRLLLTHSAGLFDHGTDEYFGGAHRRPGSTVDSGRPIAGCRRLGRSAMARRTSLLVFRHRLRTARTRHRTGDRPNAWFGGALIARPGRGCIPVDVVGDHGGRTVGGRTPRAPVLRWCGHVQLGRVA